MALLMKKDIGIGEVIDKAYIKLNTKINAEPYRWEITVQSFYSKAARERNILQEWIRRRLEAVSNSVPFDENYAANNPQVRTRAQWAEMFTPGPWNTVQDYEKIVKINSIVSRPVQEYTLYYYEDTEELPKQLNKLTNINELVYRLVQDPESRLSAVVFSPGIDDKEIVESFQDDIESPNEVITRLCSPKDSPYHFLLKRAPNEGLEFEGIRLLKNNS